MPTINNPTSGQEIELLLELDPSNPDIANLQEDSTKRVAGLFFDRQGHEIQLPFRKFTGKSYTVLGMSGSGKSSFVRSFIYYCLLPFKYPFTVFDVEGEYFKFADRFPHIQLWDQKLYAEDAQQLAKNAVLRNRPTIIDFSNSDDTEFTSFAYEYLDSLWNFASIARRSFGQNLPHLCIFEEAQELAKMYPDPGIEKKAKEMVKKYARRGRKFGPTIMLVSQRIPDMDTASVSQTQIKFLLKTDGDIDRKRYGGWMGIGEKTINRVMNYMKPGEVLIYEGKVKRDEFGEVEIPIYPFTYLDWADVSPSVKPSDIDRLAQLIKRRGDEIGTAFSREKRAQRFKGIPQPTNQKPSDAPQVQLPHGGFDRRDAQAVR